MPQQRRTSLRRSTDSKKPAARKSARSSAARAAGPAARPAHARSTAKPTVRKPAKATAAKASPVSRRRPAPGARLKRQTATRVTGAARTVPTAPATREQAVEAFERGFRALQQRQFERAAQALTAVLRDFPEEKELQDRARVYLSICARQSGAPARPRTFEERLNAATVAINRGAPAEALGLLRQLETDRPDSDHVQYLFCVALTGAGDAAGALEHLRRAVELNPENRLLSAADADLETLRQHAGFKTAVEPPQPARRSGRAQTAARRR